MSKQIVKEVLDLTNQYRVQAGLDPLVLNNELNIAAQGHSNDMATQDFFDHTGIDGSKVGDRVAEADYEYSTAGENIAAGQTTAEQVVTGWINSPGHRANILNANYKEIGIGYEYLQNDTGSLNYNHYWTQVFGTQADGKVTPAQISLLNENEKNAVETSDLGDEDLDEGPNFNLFGAAMTDLPESDSSRDDKLTGQKVGSLLVGDDIAVTFNTEDSSLIYQFESGSFDYQNFIDLLDNSEIGTADSDFINSELSAFEDFMVGLVSHNDTTVSFFES